MTDQSEFDRGRAAGGIEERLASHDRHFASINGALDRVADELRSLALNVQRLADQAVSDAGTRVATAEALKDAAESRWAPVARTIAVIGAFVALATLALGTYLATR